MMFNLKKRFSNRAFCASFAAVVFLLLNQLGLDVYFPENIMEIVNTILTILCMLGVVIDPTSEGIKDSELSLSDQTSRDLQQEVQDLNEALELREDELRELADKLNEIVNREVQE